MSEMSLTHFTHCKRPNDDNDDKTPTAAAVVAVVMMTTAETGQHSTGNREENQALKSVELVGSE